MDSASKTSLQSLGAIVRERRETLGLSQDRLAALSALSRATINELETGALKELAFTRLTRVLDVLGLGLTVAPISGATPRRTSLAAAARTASVSYKKDLSTSELRKALQSGEIPALFRPHFATLLDEAPVPLIVRAVEEAFDGEVPKSAWRHVAQWADELKSTRKIWH